MSFSRLATRRIAIVVLVLAVGTSGLTACSSSSGGSSGAMSSTTVANGAHLDPAAFQANMSKAGTVIVDVRTPAEFAAGHIAGAINVDVESSTFASDIANLDKSKTYAVYCHSGRRSGIALSDMQSAGFTHTYDLAGGIQAWTASGNSLVTS